MTLPPEIVPSERPRIIDLVKEAGIDVTPWTRFRGGEERAASNPKYCYEWAFLQPGKVALLNLWSADMRVRGGTISQQVNMRRVAARHQRAGRDVAERRALRMDQTIQTAVKDGLPVRVVVCDGRMRDRTDSNAGASRVLKRVLDRVCWTVTTYDPNTGECTLTRGTHNDVSGVANVEAASPEELVSVTGGNRGQGYILDSAVRKAIESRAMELAEHHYYTRFGNAKDTSRIEPFDLLCFSPAGEIRVGVKGSTGELRDVHITDAELRNARNAAWRTDLFLVTGIQVRRTPRGPLASGGNIRVIENWKPTPDDLRPITFRCRVSG